MIVRKLRKDEAYKAKLVMGCCFNYSVDGEAEKNSVIEGEIYGAFCDDGETLMSMISVKSWVCWFCGKKVGCVGIAGVSTYPQYRRNGCVRAIFNEIFRIAPARGWNMSLLFPFSYRYYRKFGYDVFMKHSTLTVPMDKITHIPRNQDAVLYSGQPEVLADILSVYNSYASSLNICCFRDNGALYPSDPVKAQKYTWLLYQNGKPAAYCTVKPCPNKVMEISEFVYTTPSSVTGMFGFLRSYEGQVVRFRLPFLEYDSPVASALGEDWQLEPGCYYGAEGRIIGIADMLELNEYPEGKGSVSIRVFGDVIESNNAIYDIEYKNGKGNVTTRPDTPDSKYDVSIPVTSFGRLVIGGVPAYAVPYLDGIEIKSKGDVLAACFPKRPSNLFERC